MTLTQTHCHLVSAIDALATARTLEEAARPDSEVLSMLDRALVDTHDARAGLVKFRQEVYSRSKAKDDDVVVPFPEEPSHEPPGQTPA